MKKKNTEVSLLKELLICWGFSPLAFFPFIVPGATFNYLF